MLGRRRLGPCVRPVSRLRHRGTGRCPWRRPRGQPEVLENALDARWLEDRRDDLQLATAVRAVPPRGSLVVWVDLEQASNVGRLLP